MTIKWSSSAVKNFIDIIEFLENENEFQYAKILQKKKFIAHKFT